MCGTCQACCHDMSNCRCDRTYGLSEQRDLAETVKKTFASWEVD